MKTADVARQVGMTESDLRDVNRIPPRMLVKAGSTLVVPRSAQRQADVSGTVADNARIALAPDGPGLRRVVFRAGKKGDSVSAVARRYRVSAAQVAQWNQVHAAARFAAGSTVVVFVPARAGKAAPSRKAATVKRSARAESAIKKIAETRASRRKR
jgi:membrane-bound lytic murein transglycosylase D